MSAAAPVAPSTAAAPSVAEQELQNYYDRVGEENEVDPSLASTTTDTGDGSGDGSGGDATPTVPATSALAAPAPATPAAPPIDPAIETYWNAPDPNPDLPPSLQGKSRRDVYDANLRAVQQANKAGMEKNAAERRAEIAEATLAVLREQFTPPKPAPAPPPPPAKPHELFGLADPADAWAQVPHIVEGLPGVIKQIAEEQTAPLRQEIETLRQRNAQADQTALFAQADNVRIAASRAAGIPDDMIDSVKRPLASIMWANNLSAINPEHWAAAINIYRADAARLIPQSVITATPPPPNGNRGGNGAQVPTNKKIVSTGDKKMDDDLRSWLTATGMGTVTSFDKVATSIRDRRKSPRFADEEE